MANKLDDSSSEEQQQQQQCQNTGGATNEHLNIISDTITTATTTKRQQTKSILAHGKLNDLVADLCAHNNTEFSNTRLKNGAPDVFIDNINNCAASYTTTSTSTTTTTAASSSSFSFKHFLSNSSRDMTAPSSTVTSLDPIIMSTTLNVNGESETPATTVVATTGVKTSTGARPKIPQSNSVSTTSICTLMSNTRISDGSAGSPEHLGVGVSVKMKRSPRFSSFDSQASLAEYAENKPSRRSNGHQHFATTQSTTDIDIMSKYVPRSYSNYDMPPNNSNTNSNKRRENDANFLPDSVFGCFLPTQSSASKETRPTLLPLDSLETVNVISAADSTQSGSEFASSASVAAAAAALPDFVQDHWLESWQIHDNNMRLNSPATSPVANEAAGFAGMGLTSNLRGRLAPAKLALAKNASGMKLGTSNFCGVIGDKRNRSNNNNNNNAINPNTSSLNLNKQQQQQQLEDHIEVEIGNLDNNGGIDGNHQSNTVGGKMLPDFLADRPNLHSLQRLADVAAGLPSDSVRSPESENSTLEPLSILRQENARLQNELTESAQNLNDQRRRYIILELDYQELHQQYLLQQQQFQQLQQHQHQQQQQQQQAEQDIKKIQQLEQQQQQQSNVHENNNNNNNNNHHHHNDTNDSNKHLNAESEIVALRLHLSDLTVELEKIRSENAILREGGAVGGVPVSGVGLGATGTPTASASTTAGRTVRTQQQISRDLLFAASNAENNLRQLLAGVENLRQMANEIENNDWRPVRSGEISPDLYPEYFEDVDAIYDDFRNGPPL